MDRFLYQKKIHNLDGGRVLMSEFRSEGLASSVDLYSHECTREPRLRIYSPEFEELKSSIVEFIDYLRLVNNQGYVELRKMPPSVMQRADPLLRSEPGSFLIDCSKSHIWLLVRYGGRNTGRPGTVMAKEYHFPIQLAFKVADFPKLCNLLEEIDMFFTRERKLHLLQNRLTTRSENTPVGHRLSGRKRRINLSTLLPGLEVDAKADTDSDDGLETDDA